MPSVGTNPLTSLFADLIVALLRAAVLGVESALVDVSLPIPAGLVPRNSPEPPKAATGSGSSEALVQALLQGLEQWELSSKQMVKLRQRMEAAGALGPRAKSLLEAAVASHREQEAESSAEEVDLDELVRDLEKRLTGISVDLSAVTDLWDQMDDGPRAALLDQLRYYGELHTFFSAKGKGDREGSSPSTGKAAPRKKK